MGCDRCTNGKLFDGHPVWQCKVCWAEPDEDGCVRHGRGCYRLSEDGGGEEYVEVTECPHCKEGGAT